MSYCQPMDFIAAVSANAEGWTNGTEKSCLDDPRLVPFREACAVSAIGSNFTAAKLWHFRQLTPPRIVSTYAVSSAINGADSAYKTTYVNGEWGPKRLAVDTAIGGVHTAIYGTVDLPGSIGDHRYGYFRLSYHPGELVPLVFPHNTAFVYAPNGVIDEKSITRDVAGWSERADVCVKTLGGAAVEVSADQWPMLLASEHPGNAPDLIEVVLPKGEVDLADITEIRVEAEQFDSLLKASISSLLNPGPVDLAVYVAAELAADAEAGILKLVTVEVGAL